MSEPEQVVVRQPTEGRTIGIVGMNEACLNFLGTDIGSVQGQAFAMNAMDHIRDILTRVQEETGDIFNLEATPAEGASYRLTMLDKKKYPDIVCANEDELSEGASPYYTNSTQLPVNYTDDLFETLLLQDGLQTKYTGGTVLHIFLGELVSDTETTKGLIRKIANGYRLPYFTLTPTFSVCPTHGYLKGEQATCPECKLETEIYSRVVGYLRPIKQWNNGKQSEFKQRVTFQVGQSSAANGGNGDRRLDGAASAAPEMSEAGGSSPSEPENETVDPQRACLS